MHVKAPDAARFSSLQPKASTYHPEHFMKDFDPAAFGEADRCGTRDSVFESLCDWRPLAILVEIRLAIRQAAHPNHQPTRCPTDLNGFMVESVVPQVTPHALLQLTQGLTGEIGW